MVDTGCMPLVLLADASEKTFPDILQQMFAFWFMLLLGVLLGSGRLQVSLQRLSSMSLQSWEAKVSGCRRLGSMWFIPAGQHLSLFSTMVCHGVKSSDPWCVYLVAFSGVMAAFST